MNAQSLLIVSMPWARADAPSLQLGILKAHLLSAGVKVKTLHAAPRLAKLLGKQQYWQVANNIHPLLSEACFASVQDPDFPHAEFIKRMMDTQEFSQQQIERLLNLVEFFCEELAAEKPWESYDIVGFSCTFNQLQASLWAAGEAKKYGCRTVFGGFLLQGDMGKKLLKYVSVDAVIDGPGELGLPEWMRQGCPSGYYSVSSGLPVPRIPEYDDYFADMPEKEQEEKTLLLETSRGCEHGACAFCTQNARLGRHIYPASYLDECLKNFMQQYSCRALEFADTSFPVQVAENIPKNSSGKKHLERYHVFAESRAINSSEMRIFSQAGFSQLQIGIESLHSAVLDKIQKGSSLLENVCCLRESWNHKIHIMYNIILDMPGMTETEVREMISMLPLLYHLPPPSALVSFQLQLNSAVFRHPEKYGITKISPHAHHALFGPEYPSFYFSFSQTSSLSSTLLEEAHEAFSRWEHTFTCQQPLAVVRFWDEYVEVYDARFCEGSKKYRLGKDAARLLRMCRNPQPDFLLRKRIGVSFPAVLEDLLECGLLLEENGRYLTLPVMVWKNKDIFPQAEREPMDSYFTPPVL